MSGELIPFELLNAIFKHIKYGVVVQDADGKLLYANQEARRLLGQALDQMDGGFAFHPNWRPILEDGSELADEAHPALAALRSGEAAPEITIGLFQPASNGYDWMSMGAAPLFLGSEAASPLVCTTFQDITAQKRLDRTLQAQRRDYTRLLDALSEPLVILNADRRLRFANQAAAALFERPSQELIGKDFVLLMPESHHELVLTRLGSLYNPPYTCSFQVQSHAESPARWLGWSFKIMQTDSGRPGALVGIGREITDQKRLEDTLDWANAVVENTRDGVIITDLDARILSVNDAFTQITGYESSEIIGRNPSILNSGRQDDAFYRELWTTLRDAGKWQGTLWNRRKNGELYLQRLSITTIHDRNGNPGQYVGVFSALQEEQRASTGAVQLVHHDPLTDLPNRLLFLTRLEHALHQAAHAEKQLGLLYLDIDQFKDVNDSLGYEAGDQLLLELSQRMKAVLQDVDTLSRFSGDEFAVLIENISNADELAHAAFQLKDCFSRPFLIHGQEIYTSASIGISFYPKDGLAVDDLIKNAVSAARRAKRAGRNTYQFYTSELNEHAFERMVLVSKLRRALEKGEMYLFYQPIVHIRTGKLAGVEALLRWRNPDLGLIAPVRFIPLAEESGLIKSIGVWVLEKACMQMQAWLNQGIDIGFLSVNVAQLQFQRPEFPDTVRSALSASGLEPTRLVLEVTESSLMSDVQKSLLLLNQMRSLGIRLAVDDFGTGYSSLAYLKHLPIDILKLDQSFVTRLPAETGNLAITRAVIALGQALKLEVLAEGVETETECEILVREGCRYAQGFYFSHPLDPAELSAWVVTNRSRQDERVAGPDY